VVDTTGAVVTDADPGDDGAGVVADVFGEVQPVTNTAMKRQTRRIDRTPEFFINAFLQGME
jgi:hypothetical protein